MSSRIFDICKDGYLCTYGQWDRNSDIFSQKQRHHSFREDDYGELQSEGLAIVAKSNDFQRQGSIKELQDYFRTVRFCREDVLEAVNRFGFPYKMNHRYWRTRPGRPVQVNPLVEIQRELHFFQRARWIAGRLLQLEADCNDDALVKHLHTHKGVRRFKYPPRFHHGVEPYSDLYGVGLTESANEIDAAWRFVVKTINQGLANHPQRTYLDFQPGKEVAIDRVRLVSYGNSFLLELWNGLLRKIAKSNSKLCEGCGTRKIIAKSSAKRLCSLCINKNYDNSNRANLRERKARAAELITAGLSAEEATRQLNSEYGTRMRRTTLEKWIGVANG
jgi:hypothetical protein